MRDIKGITLVALVITIIVLLILAGITIKISLHENGLLNHTEMAREEEQKQTATETMQFKITTIQMQNYTQKQRLPNLQELSDGLCEDEEIEYVSLVSKKISSLDKINVEGAESIFTKIKQYPYEFEIDGSLRLASINGAKIPTNQTNCDHISKIIEDFTPQIKETNGTYITISIPENITNQAIGYIYLINGKDAKISTEPEYSYMNLEFQTNYEISVIAIDTIGKIKQSTLNQTTSDKLYLYNEGAECIPITGGWKRTGYHVSNNGTFTQNENNMYIYSPNGSRIFCGTTNQIDLSNYSKMFIESEGTTYLYQISKTSYYSNSGGSDKHYVSNEAVDISTYNDTYYIHCTTANACYTTIKKIWLEK